MTLFCTKCGKENPANVNKCVFCGEKIQKEETYSNNTNTHRKINNKVVYAILSGVFVVALCFLFFGGNRVPNIIGVDENSAKQILIEKGYSPIIIYETDDSQPTGCVVGTNPGYGNKLSKGQQVKVYVSAGEGVAKDSVLRWFDVTGSTDDDYNFSNPYVRNNYLYLELEMKIDTNYTVLLRGFGTASIYDDFAKTVPLEYEYENSKMEKGKYQKVTIRVPLDDMENQRPTTIYLRLATYLAGKNEDIKLELDMTW